MYFSHRGIGRFFLSFSERLRFVRNLPVIGSFAHRISHRLLPDDKRVWARVERGPATGLWLELNPRTGQQYLRGEVELATQAFLTAHLRPGMVFYDLGANVGFFSLLAARLVGITGKVFSFEPDLEIASRLRRNVDRNGFTNICVVERGIWSQTMLANFVAADLSSPDRGVGMFTVGPGSPDGILTPCVTLDDFISQFVAPDVIKCDIEGAEVEAFRGADRLLTVYNPIILCELHSEYNGTILRERFTQLGYRVESVDELHFLAVPQVVTI